MKVLDISDLILVLALLVYELLSYITIIIYEKFLTFIYLYKKFITHQIMIDYYVIVIEQWL